MKLAKIELAGFKTVRECSIQLDSLNVLIGANGVGKSNFISFFKLLSHVADNGLQNYVAHSGGASALLYCGTEHTSQVEAKLHFVGETGENIYHQTLISDENNTLFFLDEGILFVKNGELTNSISFGTGHRESKLVDPGTQGKTARFIKALLERCQVYHFHHTSSIHQSESSLRENRYLAADGSNIVAFLLHLQQNYPAHYQQIRNVIHAINPDFDDFVLDVTDTFQKSVLIFREKQGEKSFNVSCLSDGTVKILCLAALLLQPELPSLIVIEEPEIGLDPYALNLLAGMLDTVSQHTQIIVSTHSVNLVDHFAPEDIVVVERDALGCSTFKRLASESLDEWLESYSLGELKELSENEN